MKLELGHRGDYAVRAMLVLARGSDGQLVGGPALAAATGIPARFLPQVMGTLIRAGLVASQAGRRGGYRLAVSAERISFLEIVEAADGDSRRQICVLRGGPCRARGVCDVHEVFFAAQEALLGRLGEATLASVVARS
jgi:Rrf2 family transcriptional regulator, iron-sulfur cluster assembly transcription factor